MVGNFDRLESTFQSVKLLFLQYHCNVNEHYFFDSIRDQNIQKKKCNDVLQLSNSLKNI
jgi:hypothetical protein